MCKSSSVNHDHKVEDKEGPRSHAYHMTLSKNLPRPLSLTGHPITPPTYSSLWPVPTTTSKAGLHSACYTPSPAHNPLVRHVRIYTVYHTHTHVHVHVRTKYHTRMVSYWLLAWKSSHSVQPNVLLCRQQKKAPSLASPWDDSCTLHTALYPLSSDPLPPRCLVLSSKAGRTTSEEYPVSLRGCFVPPHALETEGDGSGFHTDAVLSICGHFRNTT